MQILVYSIGLLELNFSVMTAPAPTSGLAIGSEPDLSCTVPLALGPRWLAYASNQVPTSQIALYLSCFQVAQPPLASWLARRLLCSPSIGLGFFALRVNCMVTAAIDCLRMMLFEKP